MARTFSKQVVDGIPYDVLDKETRAKINQIAETNLIKELEEDKYINPDNGLIATLSGYSATNDYIEVETGETYSISRNGKVYGAIYNSSHVVVQGIVNNDASSDPIIISIPSTAKYIRLSCQSEYVSQFGLYKNDCGMPSILENVCVPGMTDRLEVKNAAVNPDNYTTLLPDVNAIITDSVYKMYFALRSTDIPANLPFSRWITNTSVILITFGSHNVSGAGMCQLLIGDHFVFFRHYTSSWGTWKAIKLEVNVGTDTSVDKHFDSLTEAVIFAAEYQNAVVRVHNGVFDLYQEFIDYYGSDFFTNFDDSSPKGLYLKNGIHLIFCGGSKVTFNYTGSNSTVKSQFSPFNFLSAPYGGFTLENLTLECSNCRYCVHDDPGDSSHCYHNKYINCRMTIDNSNNTDWTSTKVIGGGLGRSGHVIVSGCLCKTDTPQTNKAIVSYHNDVSANAGKSRIEFTGNYLDGGTFGAFYGGTSQEKTDFIISNNNMYGEIIKASSGGGTVDNVDVYEWNNINRAS